LAAINALRTFLHGFRVRGKIHPLRTDFFAGDGLQRVVDVIAAQVRVTVGRKDW